ncbi:general transcription factor 3C polypeptide 5 [Anastrepha ludens]|uniref:general transcription factor 3C polypeptide 5 n=1 Tax=Anastrepha ludens TaxID=28586 RepID=UPI0023AF626E|nr:general transcription factor 3C polypeptide 5 [Anastrepha ludens]
MTTAQVNFSSNKELEVIEYPAKLVNLNRMLATLGGITNVSQALGSEQKRLELRFHPKNPFNKVAGGDAVQGAGLLISVKVRRSKKHRNQPSEYQLCILGHCKRSFTFNCLCDFQYLPLHNDPNRTENLTFNLSSIIPQSVTNTNYFSQTDVPLLSLPQIFARVDTINSTIFRADQQDDGQHDVLGVIQKSSYDSRDVVAFSMTDGFPERADLQIVKRMRIKYVSDEQLQKVKALFEECPIWTRIALLYESGVSNEKLKCIVPSLSYYFSTGPWRTLYVRYGYDPRRDFKSRYYQTFDYRLRFRSGMSEFVANRKDQLKKQNESPYELNEMVQDINYPYFEENKLPRSRQCILRYCDIHMPKIQEMIEKIPSPRTGAICNEKTGWLPAGFDLQVRQVMSNCIKELLRNHYRKGQIHAELDPVDNLEDSEGDATFEDNLDTSDLSKEIFDE